MANMARLQIDNEALANEYFENSVVIAIQTSLHPHKFIWMVNEQFRFDFRYQHGSELELERKGRKFVFPIFRYVEERVSGQHVIYTNQNDGEYLLPEMRHTDYLWFVQMDVPSRELADILAQELRKLDAIQMVSTLENDKIKNKQNLIL